MVQTEARRSGLVLFGRELRRRPIQTGAYLLVEYAMFFAAVVLALLLFATRTPMSLLDRTLGLRLRERFIELIAKASPG
jgi:hypothetical protein